MDGIQNVVKRVIPFVAASGVKTESTKVHPMVSLGKYCNHRSWVVPPTFRFWWVVLGFRFTPRVSSLARNISQPLDHSIRPVPTCRFGSRVPGPPGFFTCPTRSFTHAFCRLLLIKLPTPRVSGVVAYSQPRKSVLHLVCLGILRVGGLNTAMFPFEPVQVLAVCLDSLG